MRSPRAPTFKDDQGSQVWRAGGRNRQGSGQQAGSYSKLGGRVRKPHKGAGCRGSLNGECRGRPGPGREHCGWAHLGGADET